jgi:hypothetical protein
MGTNISNGSQTLTQGKLRKVNFKITVYISDRNFIHTFIVSLFNTRTNHNRGLIVSVVMDEL